MPFSANPPDWPAGLGRHLLAEIDSTNAEALRRAAAGAAPPQWILAGQQTAGRGRRARAWQSPSGNFYASLLIYPGGGPGEAALFSFAAALALRESLAACTGAEAALALKWPNDVLLAGRKVAGILLERQALPAGPAALAIGIGVNLISAPPPAALEPGALAASSVLAETGQRLAPEALLNALAPRLDHWGGRLDHEGFAPLRTAFLDKAAHLGQKVTARMMGGRKEEGRFVTLDGQGALILEQGAGQIAISAADIFFS